MARKNVSAAVVRNWFAGLDTAPEGIPAPGTRGRLHPDTIAAFHKANRGMRYETASEAEKSTVTFKAVTLDKAGRKTTREVILTTAEARVLLGHEAGRKGRFNMAVLVAAYEAQTAAEVADTFTNAA